MNAQQVSRYLERIQYKDAITQGADCLFGLQRQHLLHVPFENLDIHSGRRITMDTEDYFNKIVVNNRGGFCYELNGLFNELLKAIGFKTSLVSCRPYNSATKTWNEEFDHLAITVTIQESEWLADVGFGDFSVTPIRIQNDLEQNDGRQVYRMVAEDDHHVVQRKTMNGTWMNEYLFSPQSRRLDEFSKKCEYHQSSPQSHFTRNKLCSRLTPQGRITLTDTKLKRTENNVSVEAELRDEEEFRNYLKCYFGMVIEN